MENDLQIALSKSVIRYLIGLIARLQASPCDHSLDISDAEKELEDEKTRLKNLLHQQIVKTYTRKEIVAWLDEYENNPANHIHNCTCQENDSECEHDLGDADELHNFIYEKLN